MTPTPVIIGQPCPFPPLDGDGAVADFLSIGGSIFRIQMTGMRSFEVEAVRRGIIKAGILHRASAILFLFQFYGRERPVLTYAAPFDIRRVPPELRDIPVLDGTFDRLMISIMAVDEGNIVRALRAVTLPKAVTAEFLMAAAEQVESADSGTAAHAAWNRYEPVELAARHCKMEVCGK